MHLDIIKILFIPKLMYSELSSKTISEFKIYIKTTPTCFGAVMPSSECALFVLAKVTVVKIVH